MMPIHCAKAAVADSLLDDVKINTDKIFIYLFIEIYLYRVYTFSQILFYNVAMFI